MGNVILFTTRELAIIIWTSLFLVLLVVFFLKKKEFNSIFNLIKATVKLILYPIVLITLIYIGFVFYILYIIDLINETILIKEYIKLIIFALFPMIYKVITNYKEVTVLQIIRGIIKFSIIPLFIINSYTFNFFIELILVIVIIILSLLAAISEIKPEFQSFKKFSNWSLALIGIYVIVFAFKNFTANIDDVQEFIFWKKMFLELLLLCHIPLLIFLQFTRYYEKIISLIKRRTKLAENAKGQILVFLLLFKNCHLNKKRLEIAKEKVLRNKFDSLRDLDNLLDID